LATLACSVATTLITPINDSFVDVDALADIDVDRREVKAPSPFAQLIQKQRDHQGSGSSEPLDWIVARNRVGQLDNRNSQEMTALLSVLSRRLGFRVQPGFSERLVFRALFYRGLTLFDLNEAELPRSNRSSLQRARQEVGDLLDSVVKAAGRSTTAQRM
jgi:chromosome partitioning protein